MDLSEFLAFALLEVLFVGAVYMVYLHFRHSQGEAETSQEPVAEVPAADQYLAILQEAILQADARLASLNGQAEPSPAQQKLVEIRLAFLRAERKAVEKAGADEDRLWALLEEGLKPLLPDEQQEGEAKSKRVESLRLQLRSYEQRLANLEQFRTLFFDLKSQLATSSARSEKLQTEVRLAVPVEEQSPELKALLEELEHENRQLNEQLEHVEEVFSDILHEVKEPVAVSDESIAGKMSGIDKGVEQIRYIVVAQEQRITELSAMLEEKEIVLADREQLQQMLEGLREANQEMESVISVLEEENRFLQEHISALLKQELDEDESYQQQIEALRKRQEEEHAAYIALSEKFAAMEKAYLQLYEENRTLRSDGG